MKVILALLAVCILRTVVLSQAPNLQWQKCYGGGNSDDAWSVLSTSDGGYIFFGNTWSSNGQVTNYHGGSDFWVVKADNIGNLIWEKCFGGSDDEYATSAMEVENGNIILAGLTHSNDLDVNGNHGLSDGWVVKLNASGNLINQRCFGGSSYDGFNFGSKVIGGGYIFVGGTTSINGDVTGIHSPANLGDIWVVRVDTSLNIQIQKCIGGSSYESASYIQETTDHGYFIAGYPNSTDGDIITLSHGAKDYWICKLDSMANISWQMEFGGSSDDEIRCSKQTRDGGYVLAGSSLSNDGDVSGNHSSLGIFDYWIVKIDSTGSMQWQKCFGGSAIDDAFSVDTTLDGGIIVAGESTSDDGDITNSVSVNGANWWVIKTDLNGNLLWDKSLGGSNDEEAQSLCSTSDGGSIILGYTSSNDIDVTGNHGSGDYWAVKLSPDPVNINLLNENNLSLTTYFDHDSKFLHYKIDSKSNYLGKLQVLDMLGNMILEYPISVKIGNNVSQLRIENYMEGVYFLRLVSENGIISRRLIID